MISIALPKVVRMLESFYRNVALVQTFPLLVCIPHTPLTAGLRFIEIRNRQTKKTAKICISIVIGLICDENDSN